MVDNPPVLPRDAPIVAEMAKIGLAPGQAFDYVFDVEHFGNEMTSAS